MITVDDLLDDMGNSGQFLYCPNCGSQYSASKGDYFWMPKDKPFICQEDKTNMVLAVEHRTIEIIQ